MKWIEVPSRQPRQGDTVRIKSGGGPVMSVGCRIGDAHWMDWWDENLKKFKTEMLYLSQVVVVVKDPNGD